MIEGRASNYEMLLENDIVFFGPSSDKLFEYKDKKFPVITLNEEIDLDDLFGRIPEGWYPEMVVVETPVLNYVRDFYRCPVPTLCFSRDAWGDMIYNRDIARLFDFVAYQTIDIGSYDQKLVEFVKYYGVPVSLPDDGLNKSGFAARDIDVIAIANYDDGMYHKRYKLFCDIAKGLGSCYKVEFLTGLRYDEIHEYYKRSKIVVDWSNVLSSRSYEAALNGCLFFSFEDNILISSIWEKDVEYVSFNADTILEKLRHYLADEAASKTIIERARKKYETLPLSIGERTTKLIKACLEKWRLEGPKPRPFETLSEFEIAAAVTTTLYFNYQYTGHNHPPDWRELYFVRVDKALALPGPQREKVRLLYEAARMAYLLRDEEKFSRFSSMMKEAGGSSPWIELLRAKLNFESSNITEAEKYIDAAFVEYEADPLSVRRDVLPFIEKGDACDARRVLDYMWQSVYQHGNEFQGRAFLYEYYALKERLSEIHGDREGVLRWCSAAIDQVKIPEIGRRLYKLLAERKEYNRLKDTAGKVWEENPYDVLSALYLASAFLETRDKPEAAKVLDSLHTILRAFRVKVKLTNKTNLRRMVSGLLRTTIILPCKVGAVALRMVARRMEGLLS